MLQKASSHTRSPSLFLTVKMFCDGKTVFFYQCLPGIVFIERQTHIARHLNWLLLRPVLALHKKQLNCQRVPAISHLLHFTNRYLTASTIKRLLFSGLISGKPTLKTLSPISRRRHFSQHWCFSYFTQLLLPRTTRPFPSAPKTLFLSKSLWIVAYLNCFVKWLTAS